MILDTITIQQCAPMVDQQLMMRVISVESSHNPYAIGVVNAHLQRQPQNLTEAKATAKFLENAGYNYSAGLAQINRSNFSRFKLNFDNVFEAVSYTHLDVYKRQLFRLIPQPRHEVHLRPQRAEAVAVRFDFAGHVLAFHQHRDFFAR